MYRAVRSQRGGEEGWRDPWEPVPLVERFLHPGDIKE